MHINFRLGKLKGKNLWWHVDGDVEVQLHAFLTLVLYGVGVSGNGRFTPSGTHWKDGMEASPIQNVLEMTYLAAVGNRTRFLGLTARSLIGICKKGKVFPEHAMKTCRRSRTSVLGRGQWSTPCSGSFSPEKYHGTHWMRGWLVTNAGLERRISYPCRDLNRRPSSP